MAFRCDMSSEISDNIVFVSKEGKSLVRAYFGYETTAQQVTEGKRPIITSCCQ